MKSKVIVLLLLLSCLAVLLIVNPVKACPASPEVFDLTQPDGSTFPARLWGDEWFNGLETIDGYPILEQEDGWWVYAELSKDKKAFQPALARDDSALVVGISSPAGLKTNVRPIRDVAEQEGMGSLNNQNFGTQPILALFVSFSDRSETYPVSTYSGIFFGNGKSVQDYYSHASDYQFTMTPAAENFSTSNDGMIGWINLGYPHPNPGRNTDERNQKIVRDALLAADEFVDFSQFDRNYDDYISSQELHLVIMVAGYEASASGSSSPSIWAHRWSLFGTYSAPLLDGVIVGSSAGGGGYTQLGEIFRDHPATMGTLAHELGHDISWPDLYDINQLSEGVGEWSLMGSGNWNSLPGEYHGETPALPDGWSKSYQGWLNPRNPTEYLSYDFLLPAATHRSAIVVPYNIGGVDWRFRKHSGTGEYFLLEYRRMTGYDAALPGEGMLVWHIDETVTPTNDANGNRDHPLVKLLQADGNDDLYNYINRGDAGDPYPGTSNNYSIDESTNPNSYYYENQFSDIGVWIRNANQDYYMIDIRKGPNGQTYLPIVHKKQQLIKNWDFQKGRSGEWYEHSEKWGGVIYNDPFSEENILADFGAADNDLAYIIQENIPIENNLYLNFDLWINAGESVCGYYYDKLIVYLDGIEFKVYDLCRDSVDWFTESLYIRDFVENQFNLDFTFISDGSNTPRVFLDNVRLTTFPDNRTFFKPVSESESIIEAQLGHKIR